MTQLTGFGLNNNLWRTSRDIFQIRYRYANPTRSSLSHSWIWFVSTSLLWQFSQWLWP